VVGVTSELINGLPQSEMQLRRQFKELEERFKKETAEIEPPGDLKEKVHAILDKHCDLRWDDALNIVLDETQLDHVRVEKRKAKEKSGDFTDTDEDFPDSESDDTD